MKILRYRTIAEIYPYLSLEAEVLLDNGNIVYPNLSVNNKGEKEELCGDSHWTYTCPLTEVNWENVDDYYAELTQEEDNKIFEMLLDFWNNNPVFDNNYDWKFMN